jgi:hypothetical protein
MSGGLDADKGMHYDIIGVRSVYIIYFLFL